MTENTPEQPQESSRSITIPSYNSYLYSEVWEVLERRDGCVYKTKTTGRYIHDMDIHRLDAQKYTTSPISTSITKHPLVTLELLSF